MAGWGALIPEDVTGPLISILVPEVKRPSVLQVVNVPVITNDKCERWHNDAGIQVGFCLTQRCALYSRNLSLLFIVGKNLARNGLRRVS